MHTSYSYNHHGGLYYIGLRQNFNSIWAWIYFSENFNDYSYPCIIHPFFPHAGTLCYRVIQNNHVTLFVPTVNWIRSSKCQWYEKRKWSAHYPPMLRPHRCCMLLLFVPVWVSKKCSSTVFLADKLAMPPLERKPTTVYRILLEI